MKEENIIYRIDKDIIKSYINTINSNTKDKKSIKDMKEEISIALRIENVKKEEMYISIIKQMMDINNGMIETRMLDSLNIKRQYLAILEKNNEIERIQRGMYIIPNKFEDSFYSFQQTYKKAIFSHMNALYFYNMTEEIPYEYTVTVPQNYHVEGLNKKSTVFYINDDIYSLGICEVETPSGNKVRAYNLERCICDIIRSKNRMDYEHVKKVVRLYVKNNNKDLVKLSNYAEKMGIKEKVIEMVSMYYE